MLHPEISQLSRRSTSTRDYTFPNGKTITFENIYVDHLDHSAGFEQIRNRELVGRNVTFEGFTEGEVAEFREIVEKPRYPRERDIMLNDFARKHGGLR